jgi:hypothetical protein
MKANEIMKASFTRFVHRAVRLFLTDGMKGVVSETFAELLLVPILLDPRALIDSKLTEFLEEQWAEINRAISDIVTLVRPFERRTAHSKTRRNRI